MKKFILALIPLIVGIILLLYTFINSTNIIVYEGIFALRRIRIISYVVIVFGVAFCGLIGFIAYKNKLVNIKKQALKDEQRRLSKASKASKVSTESI